MVIMSYWVREDTKRSYSVVVLYCWVREDKTRNYSMVVLSFCVVLSCDVCEDAMGKG